MSQPQTLKFVRGNLPHWVVADRTYFVTLRLHNTLPASVWRELAAERQALAQECEPDEERWLRLLRDQFLRIERILDASVPGRDWLGRPEIAKCVLSNLDWLEGEREWRIYAAVAMSTHIHVLMRNMTGRTANMLDDLAQFKGFTGRSANGIIGRTGRFWAREDFDHWCRDQGKIEGAARYIVNNPVKAGLAGHWKEWPWVRLDPAVFRDPSSML